MNTNSAPILKVILINNKRIQLFDKIVEFDFCVIFRFLFYKKINLNFEALN